MPNPFGARVREALKPLTLRRLGRSIHWRVSAQDRCGKAFHFVQLRAELQEDQVHASGFELAEALGHLFRCSNKPGAQAAIRNRIVFERNALLELRSVEPLLVIRVAGGRLTYVGNATSLIMRLAR